MKISKWFRQITFNQTKRFAKLCGWVFFDNYIASIPYAVMLLAVFVLLTPLTDSSPTIPVTQILILCGVLAVQTVLYYFISRRSYITSCVGFADVIRDARLSMGEQLRLLPMGFYNRRDAGDLSTVLLRDYDTVEQNANSLLPRFMTAAARLSLSIIVLSIFDWRMMLATLISIPLCIPFAVMSYRRLSHKNEDLLRVQQKNSSHILEFVAGIQTLKAFNQTGEMFDSVKDSCARLREKSIALESASAPIGIFARAILNCGTAIVISAGTYMLLRGSLSALVLIVFLLLALNLYGPIMTLLGMVVNMTRLTHCSSRIQDIFDEPLLSGSASACAPENFDITFEKVSFSYGSSEVLHNLSLTIPEKSLTALIGPSGSGKSTIIKLIARFWDTDKGTTRLGGIPVGVLSPDDLLQHISMVFQDVYLFNDTIEENIRMGNASATQEEIITAAKQAACHEFILSLPEGYQTIVGEGGSTLSGGEKQRISIARALLKDAPVVLLDEATASLDSENEILIQQALNALVKEKTVVLIAHRLHSIQHADHGVPPDLCTSGRVSFDMIN
ncbi:MAG: ABC transporter ATP-binding protein [Lachnospiraceae bacterium]